MPVMLKNSLIIFAIMALSQSNIYIANAENNGIIITPKIEESTNVMTKAEQNFVPDELILVIVENFPFAEIEKIIEDVGAHIISSAFDGKIITIKFPYPATLADIELALNNNPNIVSVEKNYTVNIDVTQ